MSDRQSPLRILLVSARYRPFVGGTEIHTGEVAVELARRGHAVTVLTTDPGTGLAAEEHLDGVRIIRVQAWPRSSDLYLAPGLTRVITGEPWDLVHVQGYHTLVAPMALWVAQRNGIPTALTFHSGGHSSRIRNLVRPIQTGIMAPLMRRCQLLVGVSEWETGQFTERLGLEPGRIRTIPNGMSPGSGTAAAPPPEPGTDTRGVGDDPHLLSIGRLERYKGHQRIIQAMPRLLQADPGTRLTIIGEGPYRDDLDRLVDRLGLHHAVAFDVVEADDRPRLDRILATASAAVFLSEYESHGMAANEALLAGLPIVVLDATALGALVADGLAGGVPPAAGDDEVASIVLETLAQTQAGTDGRRPRVASGPELEGLRVTWPSVVDELEQAYREFLPAPHSVPPRTSGHAG